jgi:hypothetical protein
MAANNPRHGDPIIEAAADLLGSKKLIASHQFQEFLDDLGDMVTNDNSADQDQLIASISADIAKLRSVISSSGRESAEQDQIIAMLEVRINKLYSVARSLSSALECSIQEFHGS